MLFRSRCHCEVFADSLLVRTLARNFISSSVGSGFFKIEVYQSRAACGQRPLPLRFPFHPTCSDHPTEHTCARQLAALRTRAKNNFTTPLEAYTANAIHAVLKMCIPPNLAPFSCHDPHAPHSTRNRSRAVNSPDLRARRSIRTTSELELPSSSSARRAVNSNSAPSSSSTNPLNSDSK